jgi:hypothetical protein
MNASYRDDFGFQLQKGNPKELFIAQSIDRTNADTVPVGEQFTLTMSNKTMRDILNEIIRSSDAKYWIVNRDGPRVNTLS